MNDITLALAAGLVAAFNPCGFTLLPTYLALLVSGPGGMWRALRLSAAMTSGFVTAFGLFGIVISLATASIQEYLPWLTVVIGVVLVGLGGWLLTGRELLLRLPRLTVGGPSGSFLALYGYGASYAVASLSCTIGPFLAVTGLVSDERTLLEGLVTFIAYGVGMGLVVGLLSMMVAFAREAAVGKLRRVLPYVSKASGGLLILAGTYIVYYGWYELRVNAGASADDAIIGAVTEIQGKVTGWLDGLGIWWITATFTITILATVTIRVLTRPRRGAPARTRETQPDSPSS